MSTSSSTDNTRTGPAPHSLFDKIMGHGRPIPLTMNKTLWAINYRSELVQFLERCAEIQESEARLAAALDHLLDVVENPHCPLEIAVAAKARARDVIQARPKGLQ